MTRAALAATCLALTTALLLPASGATAPAPDAGGRHFLRIAKEMATTQPCVAWQQQRKRVVRFVRKGEERKKVVRVKRWRTCKRRAAPAAPVLPGAAPAPPASAPLPPPTSEPPPEPEDPTLPRLGVKAEDTPIFKYTLSRPEVPPGEVVIELNNQGEDPHNLNLQLEDGSGPEERIETVGPGAQGKARWTLPAGEYRLWCDLDGHEAAGMSATLIVAG